MNKMHYEVIYHQIRMECIRLQKEINSTKTLKAKTKDPIYLKKLEKQLKDLKLEFLEQELHTRLDEIN